MLTNFFLLLFDFRIVKIYPSEHKLIKEQDLDGNLNKKKSHIKQSIGQQRME